MNGIEKVLYYSRCQSLMKILIRFQRSLKTIIVELLAPKKMCNSGVLAIN